MNAWLDENPMALLAGAAVLLVLAVLLGVTALRSRAVRRRETERRIQSDSDNTRLEVRLAEQTARLRIIRELHEVAVHDMSVIIDQADGARIAGESDPAVALRIAGSISESAAGVLAGLRRVMTVVREGEAEADVHPQPDNVGALLDVMVADGLRIEFEETGERYELNPGAELAVYRILHEALTNALKHGGEGTQATVVFTWTVDGFQMRIDDDGVRNLLRRSGLNPNDASQHTPGVDDDMSALTGVVSGAGITEMRERTELFGGVFSSTLNAGVGFSIAASFPALRYHNGVHGVNLDRE